MRDDKVQVAPDLHERTWWSTGLTLVGDSKFIHGTAWISPDPEQHLRER